MLPSSLATTTNITAPSTLADSHAGESLLLKLLFLNDILPPNIYLWSELEQGLSSSPAVHREPRFEVLPTDRQSVHREPLCEVLRVVYKEQTEFFLADRATGIQCTVLPTTGMHPGRQKFVSAQKVQRTSTHNC
jgi:hypothetical protein